MSYTKNTTIWCDWTNEDESDICNNWYGNEGKNVSDMRVDAKKEGWSYKDGKDYCPHHTKNIE